MDKFQAQTAIVTAVRHMAENLSPTWFSESSWADIVADLTGLMYDLEDQLQPAHLSLLMSACAMAYRQAQNAQLQHVDGTPFDNQRGAALALLTAGTRLSRKAGSFLGQCVVDPTPLSPKQEDWLTTMLARAGLPPLANGGDQ
ncbi:hypothetical protein NF700_06980 [Sphingomonadaceae bacterium OTU29MARTA1]|nr:hypothetical protein NF700_06980 [Sphingomonadaceae bacterium OTU29MARTA1]